MDGNAGDTIMASKPEAIVGFEDEATKLKENLTSKRARLTIVSIVGMPGLGKTTLAKKLYDDPLIANHFYIRAWITISQEYRKSDLLRRLLKSPYIQTSDDIEKMTEARMCEELHKRLKHKRYLIVMDDMWSTRAWDDMKTYLPDDHNGSRILFTSRNKDLALRAKADSIVHSLRFFSNEEGWNLLKDKVFRSGEICTPELEEIGRKIAEKCEGLPLIVVVLGGILAKTERDVTWWHKIAKSIRSHVASDQKQYIDTMELSYEYLPSHLKPCFTYFGIFSDDDEILVSRLTRLWIAEGFVEDKGEGEEKTLEDIALEYLMDLIERSLILVGKKTRLGEIKSCHIHDVLHDLCMRKAKEENFLLKICDRVKLDSISSASLISCSDDCINHYEANPFTLRFESNSTNAHCSVFSVCKGYRDILTILQMKYRDISAKSLTPQIGYMINTFKLRVLDLSSFKIPEFPERITALVHLRYLALYVDGRRIPQLVSNLKNLETLIIKSISGSTIVAPEVFGLIRLRHLHISRLYCPEWSSSFMLANLRTLSDVTTNYGLNLFKSTPNLRELQCHLFKGLPHLYFLVKLQKLYMHADGWEDFENLPDLPTSLKQLSLANVNLPMEKISKLGKLLPNLEVLELLRSSSTGEWDTTIDEDEDEGEGFPKLKFLRLVSFNISRWNASKDFFPILKRIFLMDLRHLHELPSELGDIPTLDLIELHECTDSVNESARRIKKEQHDNGNETLKIFIPPFFSFQNFIHVKRRRS